jgi:hypothetical protein
MNAIYLNRSALILFILAPIIIWFILMYVMFTKAVEDNDSEGGLISKIEELKEGSKSGRETFYAIMGAGVFLAILLVFVFGQLIIFVLPWITRD